MRRILTDQRGMTVAEILIAIAIIGIGLVALSSVIPFAAYGIQEGNQLSTATFLANQRLEQVRNAIWQAPNCGLDPPGGRDDLGVSSPSTAPPASNGATTFPDENPMAAPYADYRRQVRIVDSSSSDDCTGPPAKADLRQVTVTVSYRPLTGVGQAPAGTSKSAVLTMYIAKRL